MILCVRKDTDIRGLSLIYIKMKEFIQLFRWGLVGISPVIVGFLIWLTWGLKVLGYTLFVCFILAMIILIGAQIKYGILEREPKEDKNESTNCN
jgi:hypothetical protein